MNKTGWLDRIPTEGINYIVTNEGKGCKWGRLVGHWNEKLEDGTIKTHTLAYGLNLETGKIYLDCSKRKIFAKMIFHTFARPIHTILNFAWHALIPISIPVTIYKSISESISKNESVEVAAKKCLIKSARSIADIVRVPLYGIAMIAVSIAAVAAQPFKPTSLYDTRALLGRLEVDLNRGKRFSGLMPCFQEGWDIANLPETSPEEDTKYRRLSSATETRLSNLKYISVISAQDFEIRLQNLTRLQILFRRSSSIAFSLCDTGASWGKLNPEQTVESPVYAKVKNYSKLNPRIVAAETPTLDFRTTRIN